MDRAVLADALAPHVGSGWELVADLTRPGTAAKVAAVRDGAPVCDLAAPDAIRALSEAPDVAAALRGEGRSTVLAAATGAPRAPTARLFSGTPAEVAATLARRASVTQAMLDAYLAADAEVRAATAGVLLGAAETAGVAVVLCERAEALTAAEFVSWALSVLAELRSRLAKFSGRASERFGARRDPEAERLARQLGRIDAGVVAALRAWLERFGAAGHTANLASTGLRVPRVDVAPAEAAGAGLAVLAAARGHRFSGPSSLGRGVLDVHRDGAVEIHSGRLARVAADTSVPWLELRAVLYGDGLDADGAPLFSIGALAAFAETVTDGGVDRFAWVAEMLRCELAEPVTWSPGDHPNLRELLVRLAPLLGTPVALRAAALCDGGSSWNRRFQGETFRNLVEAGHLDPDAVAVAVAEDPVLADHVRGALRVALSGAHLSERLWPYVAAYASTAELSAAAVRDPGVAARWAAVLSAEVESHLGAGVSRAELWAAVLTIAASMDQPTAEVVAVAAATVGG